MDDTPISKDWLPGGNLFENLLAKDLVMNVFQDGKWGSFRHGPHIMGNLVLCIHRKYSVHTMYM